MTLMVLTVTNLWRTRAVGQNEAVLTPDSRDQAVLPQRDHSENRELLQERLKMAC
jgi:hypothetical protein